jgi:hypothetical protein
MDTARRFSLLATAGLLSIAVMLGWVNARPAMSASSASELASASAYFDSVVVEARGSQPRGHKGDALTVSLGYLERLRLGMGSPFRLIDQALHDPRLDPAMQQRVSWALLARLMRGEAYVLDPAALDGLGPWSADGLGATGAAHLALIDRVVAHASDPRAGEMTIRLSYAIAFAKGELSATSVSIAEQAAALARDRALAERDVRDLLADANEHHTDVLTMLVERRGARAFRVEQPALVPLTSAMRTDAMRDVADVVGALDTLNRVAVSADAAASRFPVLGAHFAARRAERGADQPPVAPIALALRDMQTVFPAASFAGLRIAFGTAPLPDSALAMHDPRTRTLELTIGGSGGTLAHELAHDIDWQTARRLFVSAGGYSTDRAMHERRGALASSVLGMSRARAIPPTKGDGAAAPIDRPTELFARGTDWFTATALAMRGRSNGFLSAVQDAALPGYAAGAPTIGEAGVESLLSALDQMTFVPDSASDAFRAAWADAAAIDPSLVLRRVFAAPVSFRAMAIANPFDKLPAPPLAVCMSDDSPEGKAREQLVELAVEARARGIAARRARYHHGAGRSGVSNAIRALAPWDPSPAEPYIRNIESAIVYSLRSSPGDGGIVDAVPAPFGGMRDRCQPLG